MTRKQLKFLLKHIINEVTTLENAPRKWYKEKDLLLMTPQQRAVVQQLQQSQYEITSVIQIGDNTISVVLDQSKKAGFRGSNIVGVAPDGSVSRESGNQIQESDPKKIDGMTTRAELDKGVMAAVNVEAIGGTGKKLNPEKMIQSDDGQQFKLKDLMAAAKKCHAGKGSNLFVFAETGTVLPGLKDEIETAKEKNNRPENDIKLDVIASLDKDKEKEKKPELVGVTEDTFLDKIKQKKQIQEGYQQEGGVLYKDRQGGRDLYWIWSTDEQRKIFIKPESASFYTKKGYRLVDLKDADRKNEETGTAAVSGYSSPAAFSKKKVTEGGRIQDPTKEEMLKYLETIYSGLLDRSSFDDSAEVAIYWFADFNHGGQSSNLYSVLSTSPFNPGRMAKGPEKDSIEADMYECLEKEFGGKPGLDEMTSTGAVAGYMTPYAFSKSKEGSPKAIQAAKRYGTIVKSIAKEEQ